MGQDFAEPPAIEGVERHEQPDGQGDHRPWISSVAQADEGEGREGQIGRPFRREGPRRPVPFVDDHHRKPGVRQGRGRRQPEQRIVVGVEALAQDERRGHDDRHHGQHEDVGRIDPRQPGDQEPAVTVTAAADLVSVNVGQDEARQDEEEIDGQPGALDQADARAALGDHVELVVKQHHAKGEPEADAGQGQQPLRQGLRRRVWDPVGAAAALPRKSGGHQTRPRRNGR